MWGEEGMGFFFNKKESEKQQRWKEGWNLNGICDKVTFRKISAPSPLNKKVLIPGKRGVCHLTGCTGEGKYSSI